MTLSSRKYKGQFTKQISVTTNDPKHSKEKLVCKGQVRVPAKLDQPRINFGKIARKAGTQQRMVVITRGDGGPLKPELEPVDVPGIAAQLKEIEAGEKYELEVTLSPPFKSPQLRANLKLKTGVAEAPSTSIPVFATITPKVVARPKRVRVPAQRKTNWEQAVSLVWDDDEAHKILRATVSDPKLNVAVEEKDGVQKVVLRVPQGYRRSSGACTVTIQTNDSEMPQVQVPVAFTGAKRSKRARTASAASLASQKQKNSKANPLPSTEK